MRKKPIRVLVAVLAVVAAGLGVAALSGGDKRAPAVADTVHGTVHFAKGERRRMLNAAAAVTDQTPPDELVAQGRAMFRNTALYRDGEACQTCHAEGGATANLGTIPHKQDTTRPVSPSNFNGPRDPPALWGVARTAPYGWTGATPTLRAMVMNTVKGHMKDFAPGGPCAGDASTSDACVQEAGERTAKLVAYVKTLDPPDSPFDEGTMSAAALRGEKLFQGKGGCIECHGGPLFTDNRIHDTGVPQVPNFSFPGVGSLPANDPGAGPPPLPPACRVPDPPEGCQPTPGPFLNTPQLRDLRNTGPYMHNGVFTSLRQVVEFYNSQSLVAPLNLSDQEISDLVAFLNEI
jgi:cytochrome c peroxidase